MSVGTRLRSTLSPGHAGGGWQPCACPRCSAVCPILFSAPRRFPPCCAISGQGGTARGPAVADISLAHGSFGVWDLTLVRVRILIYGERPLLWLDIALVCAVKAGVLGVPAGEWVPGAEQCRRVRSHAAHSPCPAS